MDACLGEALVRAAGSAVHIISQAASQRQESFYVPFRLKDCRRRMLPYREEYPVRLFEDTSDFKAAASVITMSTVLGIVCSEILVRVILPIIIFVVVLKVVIVFTKIPCGTTRSRLLRPVILILKIATALLTSRYSCGLSVTRYTSHTSQTPHPPSTSPYLHPSNKSQPQSRRPAS